MFDRVGCLGWTFPFLGRVPMDSNVSADHLETSVANSAPAAALGRNRGVQGYH